MRQAQSATLRLRAECSTIRDDFGEFASSISLLNDAMITELADVRVFRCSSCGVFVLCSPDDDVQWQAAHGSNAATLTRMRAELKEAQEKANKLKPFKSEADALRRQLAASQDACRVRARGGAWPTVPLCA